MDSAQALIIIALRAKAVETAIDHLQPKMVAVVTAQESIDVMLMGCMPFRERGVEFKWHPVDDSMQIGEAFRRFDRVLAQFQRSGYSNGEILLDATGVPRRSGWGRRWRP